MDQFRAMLREIDTKIKHVEAKLEKPYLIGFNSDDKAKKDAEDIVNELLNETGQLIAEQLEIGAFLEKENKELEENCEQFETFVNNCNTELDEYETYATQNVANYQKFVPPADQNETKLEENEEISSEDNLLSESSGFPHNLQDESFDEMKDVIDDTVIEDPLEVNHDLPSAAGAHLPSSKKKLNFDFMTPTERASDEEVAKKQTKASVKRTVFKQEENISGILDIKEMDCTQVTIIPSTSSDCQHTGYHLSEASHLTNRNRKQEPIANKLLQTDQFSRRETLSEILLSDQQQFNRRDNLLGKSQRDTLSEILLSDQQQFTKRDTPLAKSRRDTLSEILLLDQQQFSRRDTLLGKSRRETLGFGKELPTGPGPSSEMLRRDTLSGEIISSRRLSHYVPIPKKKHTSGLPPEPKIPSTLSTPKFQLGVLPSPPKEPQTSALGLMILAQSKNRKNRENE